MTEIRLEQTKTPKALPSPDDPLVFGTIFTDHMLEADYTEGKGWHDVRIVPYHNLELDPAAMVFHYGQEMFEGLKAYIFQVVKGMFVIFHDFQFSCHIPCF